MQPKNNAGAISSQTQWQTRVWKVIKSLNGTPDANAPNEAMVVNNKVYTTDHSKATKFAQHYANVSRHTFTSEDRSVNREAKKRLRVAPPEADPEPSFTLT